MIYKIVACLDQRLRSPVRDHIILDSTSHGRTRASITFSKTYTFPTPTLMQIHVLKLSIHRGGAGGGLGGYGPCLKMLALRRKMKNEFSETFLFIEPVLPIVYGFTVYYAPNWKIQHPVGKFLAPPLFIQGTSLQAT